MQKAGEKWRVLLATFLIMKKLDILQNRITELLAVAHRVQDRQNTSVFISLEDFHNQKYYLYCSKLTWQKSLHLPLEGKRFIELSREEFINIKQQQS